MGQPLFILWTYFLKILQILENIFGNKYVLCSKLEGV